MTDDALRGDLPAKPSRVSFARQLGLRGAVGEVSLPRVDAAAWRMEDEASAMRGDKRLRFGVARDLIATLDAGAWETAGDGSRVWSLDVVSTGATAVRVHLKAIDLPEGAMMLVHSPTDAERVYGPISGRGWRGSGAQWTPTTAGPRQRIEVRVPAGVILKPGSIVIDRVMHVYRDPIEEGALRGPGCSDVLCQSSWANTNKACAAIGYVGDNAVLCSGTMLTTTANDLTPYWMTANHCISTDADAADCEVFWTYQAGSCGGSVPTLTSVPRSQGCTLVSTGTLSDYSLLMVDGALPAVRAWAGWTSTQPVNGVASACIHQAGGGPKKISMGSMAGTTNNPCSPSGHLRVNWTAAGTEPGSSGSGIFRSDNQQYYGHLHCGPSACSVSGSYDGFGAFSADYGFVSSALAAGSDDALENNDSCVTARAMTAGTNAGLVVKSTDEDWYKVTLQPGQTVTTTITFVNAYGDIDLAVYGSCGAAALAVSDGTDDSEALQVTNPASTAVDAYFRVYLYNGGAYPDTRSRYNLTIAVTNPAAPPNNACANAATLAPGTTSYSTFGATTDGPSETLCNNFGSSQIGQDIWYRYTSGVCGGTVTVSLCGSNFDTRLAVYNGCPTGPNTAIACNDDACDVQSSVTFGASPNQTYLIRVGGYGAATGGGTITLTAPALVNDACAGAITLPGPGTYGVSTCGATTDGPDDGTACLSAGASRVYNDVWYRYTPVCAGPVRVNLCGSTFDTRVSVYGATCPSAAGQALACNDESCGSQSQVVFAAAAGVTYLIRAGSYSPTVTGTISLQVNAAADWDANGTIEPADVALYVTDWLQSINAGTRRADMDMNGRIDPADIAAFVNAWLNAISAGC